MCKEVNESYLLYKTDKGNLIYRHKKPYFEKKDLKEKVDVGLVKIKQETVVDKGKYAFTEFQEVESVVPENYNTLEFFKHTNLPSKIERFTYRGNVFLKEHYRKNIYIKGYGKDGNVIFYEKKYLVKDGKEVENLYYTRVDEVLEDKTDLTKDFQSNIKSQILNKQESLDQTNQIIVNTLRDIEHKVLSNGVIKGEGLHEDVVIYDENNEIKIVWLGFRL